MQKINIIGAGLAGCEACYYLLNKGYEVHLYEQRGVKQSPAHHTSFFGELVCSNSLKNNSLDNACGLLKEEMRHMNSLTMKAAEFAKVPSGNALSVDRDSFAEFITKEIKKYPNLVFHNEEISNSLDGMTIIATGPLTSDPMVNFLERTIGSKSLSFFDASAPIVSIDSIDFNIAYKKSRYDQGDNSYINCPFDRMEYFNFYNELINAQTAPLHDFDTKYFEGCMPIEVMAKRGVDTIRFGPLKPKGLRKPDGTSPYAVVQLRQDNLFGNLYNIVGFQTNLTYGEQKRVFRMIPGLQNAEFVRYGLMHRNTFINSPRSLNVDFSLINEPNVFIAGQLSGVEGYVESAATGIYAAMHLEARLLGKKLNEVSTKTMLGALVNYVTKSNPDNFSPMNANFSILEDTSKDTRLQDAERSLKLIDEWWSQLND